MRNTDHNLDLPPESASDHYRSEIYRKIMRIVDTLSRTGILQKGLGQCISMSDLVKSMLEDQGIAAEMIECECTINVDQRNQSTDNKAPRNMVWLGYEDKSLAKDGLTEQLVDTHMIVITKTDPPWLIDSSIVGYAPGINCLVEPVLQDKNTRPGIIAQFRYQHSFWVYRHKIKTRLPQYYQNSIVNRIQTDLKVSSNIRLLAVLVCVALTISSVNAVRGAYDFWLIYHQKNNWGPAAMQEIKDKIESIEQKLNTEGK